MAIENYKPQNPDKPTTVSEQELEQVLDKTGQKFFAVLQHPTMRTREKQASRARPFTLSKNISCRIFQRFI